MDELAIAATGVTKNFKLPHEKHSGLKQVILNFSPGGTTYETQSVLHRMSFHIRKGEFVGIVGRNGSGKSTLLKILAGIYQPTSGKVEVHGKLVPFIELGVGFNPELSGKENVFLNAALLGFSHKETEEMYDGIVDFAELHDFMDQKLKNYSSGMQVRLAFSIAIRAKSDILLIDEVLAVGDANFQQKCFDYFEQLKRTKQTVVFVSHDMGAVRRFCTRAIYISKGDLVLDGSPADVADLYAESNMASPDPRDVAVAESQLSKQHSIRAKISERTANSVKLRVEYTSREKDDMYVALSVVKDGVSIAEITTDLDRPLTGSGETTYSLDTSLFNPGLYQIAGVCLFRMDNRQLLALSKEKNEFVVKGNDPSRAGAVKLEDTWQYGKN